MSEGDGRQAACCVCRRRRSLPPLACSTSCVLHASSPMPPCASLPAACGRSWRSVWSSTETWWRRRRPPRPRSSSCRHARAGRARFACCACRALQACVLARQRLPNPPAAVCPAISRRAAARAAAAPGGRRVCGRPAVGPVCAAHRLRGLHHRRVQRPAPGLAGAHAHHAADEGRHRRGGAGKRRRAEGRPRVARGGGGWLAGGRSGGLAPARPRCSGAGAAGCSPSSQPLLPRLLRRAWRRAGRRWLHRPPMWRARSPASCPGCCWRRSRCRQIWRSLARRWRMRRQQQQVQRKTCLICLMSESRRWAEPRRAAPHASSFWPASPPAAPFLDPRCATCDV